MGFSCTSKATKKLENLKRCLAVGMSSNSFHFENEDGLMVLYIIEENRWTNNDGSIRGRVNICIDEKLVGHTVFQIDGEGKLTEGCRFLQAAEKWLEEGVWATIFDRLFGSPWQTEYDRLRGPVLPRGSSSP